MMQPIYPPPSHGAQAGPVAQRAGTAAGSLAGALINTDDGLGRVVAYLEGVSPKSAAAVPYPVS